MKKGSKGVVILAMVFLLMGVFWMATIHKRCTRIVVKRQAVSSGVPAVKMIRVRSPHAKDYHIVLFWMITTLEILCSIFYIFAGITLLRLYPISRKMALRALSLDLLFKISAVAYMQFCAIPLQQLTNNRNIMIFYFVPNSGVFAKFSSFLSGLNVFQPRGVLYLLIYIVYMFGCFYFFTRPEVKKQFQG